MVTAATAGSNRKSLVLAAMIFAVAMTFIDQTIVSIAVPKIESELHLSINGVQWVVNVERAGRRPGRAGRPHLPRGAAQPG